MFQHLRRQLRAAFVSCRLTRKEARRPRRAAALCLEVLEDRLTPDANITITNPFLVDANNNALTAPPNLGAQFFLHADFTTQDLPPRPRYPPSSTAPPPPPP